MAQAPGVNDRPFQTAADFFYSKATWWAILVTGISVYRAYNKEVDWDTAMAMMAVAWGFAWNRDAVVKADRKGT